MSSINYKCKTSKKSKSSNLSKNSNRNAKTLSNMRKMKGGSGSGSRSKFSIRNQNTYNETDVEEFFKNIIKSRGGNGYFAHTNILSKTFFQINHNERHILEIKPEWINMVNTCFNKNGHTPLYFALRYNAEYEMIDMLLEKITDINRKNNIDSTNNIKFTDGSTPLIGLCYGPNESDIINWQKFSDLLAKLCKRKADTKIKNTRGETAFTWLKYKGDNGLIDYF